MKKFLAVLLSGVMMAAPMAAFAEAQEQTDLNAVSFSVTDLKANFAGLDLDFTGLTSVEGFVSNGAATLFSNELTVGGQTALELDALMEGTLLTAVLFNAEGAVQPALTLDAAPYIEMIQQQMSGGSGDLNATVQEVTDALNEALAGLQVSEAYTADVTYPDGTVVPMTLTDYILPAESATPLIGKILTLAGQNTESMPEISAAVTAGASEDGAQSFYELALAAQDNVLDAMVFGTTAEDGSVFELQVKTNEEVVAEGELSMTVAEDGVAFVLGLQAGPAALTAGLTLQPAENGVAGSFELNASVATGEESAPQELALSFNYAVEQKAITAEAFDAAVAALKGVPAITVEQLSDTESEATQQALGSWMGAAMGAVEAMRSVPAVEMLYNIGTAMLQSMTSAGEAAQ